MLLSQYFLPILKENPTEAAIASHRLMLRAGMISQTAAGIYSWLPLGNLVLKNIEKIVREEMNKVGALEIIMPTVQPFDLWQESGRAEAYGQEMLRLQDRHHRDLVYAPTAEEVFIDIARRYVHSYRDLPKTLYQMHWKFRDEIRPRFGVMRGREFLMKDAYSLDLTAEDAQKTYRKIMEAYIQIFARLELTAIPVRAPTGPIGGDLSHEFHILANTGESTVYYDSVFEDLMKNPTLDRDLDTLMALYCMEQELHDPKTCPVPAERLKQKKGIEVGHIFYSGTKYTDVMKAHVKNDSDQLQSIHTGCYGIGISRLVGAIIEAHHDQNGIIWPTAVAPFQIGLINLKQGDTKIDQCCQELYQSLQERGISVLYDDRVESVGVKLSTVELIGLPWQIRVGPKSFERGYVEVKHRATGHVEELSSGSALAQLTHHMSMVR